MMKLKSTNTLGGRKIKVGGLTTLLGFIILVVAFSILSPAFFTTKNINNMLLQAALNGIVAIGMTFVIITGGIDLSVGSIVAVAGMVSAEASKASCGNSLVVILTAIAVGLLVGSINGLLISKGKLPAFIATLGMMSIARGATLLVSGGRPITGFPDVIKYLGTGQVGPVFVPVIVMVILYILAWFIFKYTKFGRYVYAFGGNAESARLSGINIGKVNFMVYAISGLLCAVTAILLNGRLNTAQPTAGDGYEMDAIASAVIGGCSLAGGEGRVLGTLIGALIMSTLKNGLNLMNVSTYIQQILVGIIIIIAVFADKTGKNKK